MELLTVKETAEMLRVAPITVRRYIADGRLPAIRVGRGVRVRREGVEQLATPFEPGQPTSGATRRAGRALTREDPLWELVGSASDAHPSDASKKHEYLADALAPTAK